MFGHKAKPSHIYVYRCHAPEDAHLQLINREMLHMHRYRNKLVELDRKRRDETAALTREYYPNIAELEQAYAAIHEKVEALGVEMRAANAKQRKRQVAPEKRAEMKQLKADRADIVRRLKAAKAEAYGSSEHKARLEQVEEAHTVRTKTARSECGLYWGNYLAIEQDMSKIRSGAPAEFKRWMGDHLGQVPGRIAVQLQGGMSTAELEAAQDTRLRITRNPNHPKLATVQLRIGSSGRSPVFVSAGVLLHRPLPEGQMVKWAYLQRRKVGPIYHWKLLLVLSADELPVVDRAKDGAMTVDVGWRLVDNGLRVATWEGNDGDYGTLVIPPQYLQIPRKLDDLKSTRAGNFNWTRDHVAAWLKTNQLLLPTWTETWFAALPQWQSQERLHAVLHHLRENRFHGDRHLFRTLVDWAEHDEKLWREEANLRLKFSDWRLDFYRNFIARQRRKYATCIVENVNWAVAARKPAAEEVAADFGIKYYRLPAAVGLLRELLSETMLVDMRDADWTTKTCHGCKHRQEDFNPLVLMHTCSNCGLQWDQDLNACRNLWHAAPARIPHGPDDTPTPPGGHSQAAGGDLDTDAVRSADVA